MANTNDRNTLFGVVELTQECNEEKLLNDERIFSSRENALAFLYHRFCRVRNAMEDTCGVHTADFSDDGYFVCIDKDGDSVEGYVSEGLTVDAKLKPEYIEAYRNKAIY